MDGDDEQAPLHTSPDDAVRIQPGASGGRKPNPPSNLRTRRSSAVPWAASWCCLSLAVWPCWFVTQMRTSTSQSRCRAQGFVGAEIGILFNFLDTYVYRPSAWPRASLQSPPHKLTKAHAALLSPPRTAELSYARSRRSGAFRVYGLANELVNYDPSSWDWRGGRQARAGAKSAEVDTRRQAILAMISEQSDVLKRINAGLLYGDHELKLPGNVSRTHANAALPPRRYIRAPFTYSWDATPHKTRSTMSPRFFGRASSLPSSALVLEPHRLQCLNTSLVCQSMATLM